MVALCGTWARYDIMESSTVVGKYAKPSQVTNQCTFKNKQICIFLDADDYSVLELQHRVLLKY